jgi:hypothetical protein
MEELSSHLTFIDPDQQGICRLSDRIVAYVADVWLPNHPGSAYRGSDGKIYYILADDNPSGLKAELLRDTVLEGGQWLQILDSENQHGASFLIYLIEAIETFSESGQVSEEEGIYEGVSVFSPGNDNWGGGGITSFSNDPPSLSNQSNKDDDPSHHDDASIHDPSFPYNLDEETALWLGIESIGIEHKKGLKTDPNDGEVRSLNDSIPFKSINCNNEIIKKLIEESMGLWVTDKWIPKGQKKTPKAAEAMLGALVINLYSVWQQDPSQSIRIPMGKASWKKGRYNPLGLGERLPLLVHHLHQQGAIGLAIGFQDSRTGVSSQSRIWPKQPLIDLFNSVELSDPKSFSIPDNTETILLRNEQKQLIDYKDASNTIIIRSELTRYNELIQDTDIQLYGKPVSVSCHSKLVYRVFNRGSFKCGGRLYGGGWSNIPSLERKSLTINGKNTIELDYSGLHIHLLYAEKDLTFNSDPYKLDSVDRGLAKLMLLTAINAKNDKEAFSALRKRSREIRDKSQFDYEAANSVLDDDNQDEVYPLMQLFNAKEQVADTSSHMKNKELQEVLSALKALHAPIADQLCSDAGIRLMRTDSNICMRVLMHFVDKATPVLSVHDSFIVADKHEAELKAAMLKAVEAEVGLKTIPIG